MKVIAIYKSSDVIPFAIFYCKSVDQTDTHIKICTETDEEICIEDYEYYREYTTHDEHVMVNHIRQFIGNLNEKE